MNHQRISETVQRSGHLKHLGEEVIYKLAEKEASRFETRLKNRIIGDGTRLKFVGEGANLRVVRVQYWDRDAIDYSH